MKKLITNVAVFILDEYGLKLEQRHWGRIGALIKRVGYKHLINVLIKLEKKFTSVDQLLNYTQKIAEERAMEEIENV